MSLSELAQAAKEGTHRVQQEFTRPDDDWAPVMLLETETGTEAVEWDIPEPELKDLFALKLSTFLAERKATAVAFVTSSWMLSHGAAKEWVATEEAPQISQHPKRVEVVFVTCISREEEEAWLARILRVPGRPPRLGPWEHFGSGAALGGRFTDAIKVGLLPRPQG